MVSHSKLYLAIYQLGGFQAHTEIFLFCLLVLSGYVVLREELLKLWHRGT